MIRRRWLRALIPGVVLGGERPADPQRPRRTWCERGNRCARWGIFAAAGVPSSSAGGDQAHRFYRGTPPHHVDGFVVDLTASSGHEKGAERYRAYGRLDVSLSRDAAPRVRVCLPNAATLSSRRLGCLVLRPELDLTAACF